MTKQDISSHMATPTLQEYDDTITQEMTKLRGLRKDLFLVAVAFLAAGGACLYFDAPFLGGGLFVIALFFNQYVVKADLEVSMREANWSLALLIQRQSNDLQAIRQKFGLVDDEEEDEDAAE